MEEGDVAFSNIPLIQVRAPLIQAQILETPLLAIVNFQTLIATKASRVVQAAQGDKVLEFGLRRAQGIDGALSASRAAYIGGVEGTSNVLAGKLWNIPVKGTHAHAWVMAFPTELEAFEAYANTMANNCTFLVDTYDTIEGVKNAIRVGQKIKEKGHQLAGIRLDSGDMTALSIEARRLLDEAGFTHASIVASNDLEEDIIYEMKKNGAKVDVWAVGTHLVTARNQPALGGVYKLSAIHENNQWKYRIKLSEQAIKISTPGILESYRFLNNHGKAILDVLVDSLQPYSGDFIDEKNLQTFQEKNASHKIPLLKKIFEKGNLVYEPKNLEDIRKFSSERKKMFDSSLFELYHPQKYSLYLEKNLFTLKSQMVKK
jgi:nicotinate phosphoribosyltransferase